MKFNRAEEISKKGLTFNPCCAIIKVQREPIASCFSFLMGFRVFPCFFPEATIYFENSFTIARLRAIILIIKVVVECSSATANNST